MKPVELTLPPAPPQEYLAWMEHLGSVQQAMLAHRPLERLASAESAPFLNGWVASYAADVVVGDILRQAREAAQKNASDVAPVIKGATSLIIAALSYMERRGAWLDQDQVCEALDIPVLPTRLRELRRRVVERARVQLGGRGQGSASSSNCPCCGSRLGPGPAWVVASGTSYCAQCMWVLPAGDPVDQPALWCPVHHARASRGREAAEAIERATFVVIPGPDRHTLRLTLPATAESAVLARAALDALKPPLSGTALDRMRAILTELVESVVGESPTTEDEVLEVLICSKEDVVNFRLGFGSRGLIPAIARAQAPDQISRVLDEIADAWGVDPDTGEAWAEIALAELLRDRKGERTSPTTS